MKKSLHSAGIFLFLGFSVSQANVVINFNNLPDTSTGDGFSEVDAPYNEQGYSLTTASEVNTGDLDPDFYSIHSSASAIYSGSVSMAGYTPGGVQTVILSQIGDGPFSLLSIQMDAFPLDGLDDTATVEFTGNLLGGGTVTEQFLVNDMTPKVMQTFSFTGFDNVVSVSWEHLDGQVHFDNITVVPEPATYALILSGTLGVLCLFRRRRR